MLPANPFLQLVLPRLQSALLRVSKLIWQEVAPVEIAYGGSFETHIPESEARSLNYAPVSLPFAWGKLFDQGWFKLLLPELPSDAVEGPLYLQWRDQGEGTLYYRQTPYAGFDVAHREVLLPSPLDTQEFFLEGLCLQSAIWHPEATGLDSQGSLLSEAAVVRRDDLAWKVYHDLKALVEVALCEYKNADSENGTGDSRFGYIKPIESSPVSLRRMLRVLDDAINALDKEGLAGADRILSKGYQTLSKGSWPINAILTGHAHIDLVWLWPEQSGEYKAVHTFSTQNHLMERYPEFTFSYSQPHSYEAVAKRSPALMEAVKQRITSKRWEALGATQVESDTLLACGEALTRSFLVGQEGFKELTGSPSSILWIPDVFGYAGSLPQIMKETGVEYFFTTKLTWSRNNLFPYSSFKWRGIDGSEVVVHVTQGNGYNQIVAAKELRDGADGYRQSDIHDAFLAPTGYGDGGGGVTAEMCEIARRYQNLAGVPNTRWGSIQSFFETLEAVRSELPQYDGELYLEFHRGIYTTHGGLKLAFRALERALQQWEAVRVLQGGGEIPVEFWKRLIFAQFHDYIPGSSIAEVYEEAIPELTRLAEKALQSSVQELESNTTAPEAALFNPLPLPTLAWTGEASDRKAFLLPALSGSPLSSLQPLAAEKIEATPTSLRSRHVEAHFTERGTLRALTIQGESIPLKGELGELALYPDIPQAFDAWDIDRQAMSLGEIESRKAEGCVERITENEAILTFKRPLGKRSFVTAKYRIDAFEPILHVEWEIDWHEEKTLLKALFATDFQGQNVRYGAPFGSVLRSQRAGDPRVEAQFEVPGSRWAVISDDGESQGLSLVTEAKYGFSARHGLLGLSLLRAPKITGEDHMHQAVLPRSLRRLATETPFTDQGKHHIRVALALHTPSTPQHNLAPALADRLFTLPLEYRGGAFASPLLGLEGGESLIPAWAKPIDSNRWVLRLHETFGRRGKTTLELAPGWVAYRTRLDETTIEPEPLTEVPFTPYQIISLLISRSNSLAT